MKPAARFLLAAGITLLALAGAGYWRWRVAWRVPGPDSRVSIPVFVLHRVLPGEATEYIISPDRLKKLVRELNRRGFTPVSLGQLHAALHDRGPLPRKPAMITFDDAYLDMYVHALPVLRKHGWPAVFFAPTGKMSDPPAERVVWGDGPDPRAMQWPELIALKEAGMEIGSHAWTHINLAKALPETVNAELETSRREIAERIGVAPMALAYPGGRHSREVRRAAAEAGYRLGFLSGGGPIPLGVEDLYALPRVHVPGYADPAAIVSALPENVWR
ncbi:MAG TPA: polysaccharide deacetylase family protein [Kiritimatiellia bacterium]|nr:polysaccharide deacetylase family protein [Kiritimatiellia bacterium]HRZ11803.1 polysaccharide deacetylase family protein [Kiritimatiellia bacterium]HSA17391.1 polysaccharide deacetylase family protein [Kiritimatiellia bacterium]